MSSLDWVTHELQQLSQADLLRQRTSRSGKVGAKIVVDGKQYINFGSNDYLGIASDSGLQHVIEKTLLLGGWGSGASPLIVGRSVMHAELERRLGSFLNREAALLFPTGYATNCGIIPALVRKAAPEGTQDIVYSDAKNHASIIDGCRLSGAKIIVYPHNDVARLTELMAADKDAAGDSPGRKLIVTDSLFSMDGDFAPLVELADLADEHAAMLMVDEAHALGVMGPKGQGVTAELGVEDRVHLVVGTLSKSLGSHGGFVAGQRDLIEYLANRARSYVFSTASPAATASAALEALNLLRDQPERRERLLQLAHYLREQLQQQGWNIGRTQSHIVPVFVGQPAVAIELARQLRMRNLWVPCIRPPSVPPNESLLRISLSSVHSKEMIDVLLESFAESRLTLQT